MLITNERKRRAIQSHNTTGPRDVITTPRDVITGHENNHHDNNDNNTVPSTKIT